MGREVKDVAIIGRIQAYIGRNGIRYTIGRAWEILCERVLHSYERSCCRTDPTPEELEMQLANQPDAGLISIAIPVYNTRPEFLRALAASLTAQTYANWEAVLYDGGSTDATAIAAMNALDEPRIRVIHGASNEGISGNTNRAIAACRGGYVALCDHDDTLTPDALWHVARAICEGAPDMIYSDEDRMTEDGRIRTDPHRKPDFCPDNLRSGNYVCHLMVIRRELLTELGGLRPDFDGSQDHDLTLRIAERTQRICHIPRVLYHWRTVGSSMSHQRLSQCQNAAARAVTEHVQRIGCPGECEVEEGVLRLRYELPDARRITTIRIPDGEGCAYVNRAASRADGNYLLILSSGVTGIGEAEQAEMLMYAQRDDVAAVTPMLTDRRGRIVHAGFIAEGGRIVSRNAGLPGHAGGWHALNRTSHNVMAVSLACMMIRRDHFVPLDEGYADGLAAVDWCLRQAERGLQCVYTPHAKGVCEDGRWLDGWSDEARLHTAHPGLRDACATGPERA